MRKASAINKALLLLTLLFAVIAALSFAAFRETETLCTDASKKCSEAAPVKHNGGGMLWDDFSRRFVSMVSVH